VIKQEDLVARLPFVRESNPDCVLRVMQFAIFYERSKDVKYRICFRENWGRSSDTNPLYFPKIVKSFPFYRTAVQIHLSAGQVRRSM